MRNAMYCTAYPPFKYKIHCNAGMARQGKLAKRPARQDDIFKDFRQEIESMMKPWPELWRFPRLEDIRVPLCDMSDKGDRYDLKVEVPGVEKDKIDVKATRDYVELAGQHSEKTEKERKNYIYNERSYRSFYRKIPMPEEIDPSKVNARMDKGILTLELPKKTPKAKRQATRVEVK